MVLLYHRFVLRVNGLGFDELHEAFIEAVNQLGSSIFV